MQKTINIILKAAAALLAVTLAASCVFEKEEPSQTQQKYKYVLVQLGVNTDKMTATKADGDVTESDPETAINDLRVYAYTNETIEGNSTKRLCGYLSTQNVNAAATATQPLLMDIKVPFNEYEKEQTVYFAAVANTGAMDATERVIINELGRNTDGSLDLPSNFSWDGFSDIIYKINQAKFATTGMPMYFQTDVTKAPVDQSADDYDPENKEDDDAPVKINLKATGTSVNQSGHNGHTKLPIKVTLGMTRSLAKITVHAAEDAAAGTSSEKETDITITGVTIYNAVKDGLLFGGTLENPDTEASVSLFETGQTVEVAHAVAEADATTGTYTPVAGPYYLAENKVQSTYGFGMIGEGETLNTDGGETFLKIDYKVGNISYSGYVQMPPIERNTWYKVLARITAGKEIKLNIVALPWDDADEQTINFLDNVTLTNSGWEGDGFTNNSEKATLSFGPGNDKAATFKFTLDTPRNGTWYATIEDGDIQNFAFVDENDDNVKTVSGTITGTEQSFTIKPLEVLSVGEKKSVQLRFVAVTEDKSRSLTVKFGSKDFYTIEQAYNVTNN